MTEKRSTKTVLAGKYELMALAGEGGMAQVWRAVLRGAAGFNRAVAVKRMLPEMTGDPELVAMFVEEARVCSRLIHPNIVQILDFDTDSLEHYFMVMEWVEGVNLRDYLLSYADRGAPTMWPLVVAICIEALRGLGAAHSRLDVQGQPAPVIHRDVTPQNVLIGENGVVKLTDFGVARASDRASWTSPHVVKGKLAYMAPEIFEDRPVSVQSDLFSLGVMLWEGLAGRRLYQHESDVDVFMAAREAIILPLAEQRDDLPETLTQAVERALARDPGERFETALEMIRALAATLREAPHATDDQVLARSVSQARVQFQDTSRARQHTRTMVSREPVAGDEPSPDEPSPGRPTLDEQTRLARPARPARPERPAVPATVQINPKKR